MEISQAKGQLDDLRTLPGARAGAGAGADRHGAARLRLSIFHGTNRPLTGSFSGKGIVE